MRSKKILPTDNLQHLLKQGVSKHKHKYRAQRVKLEQAPDTCEFSKKTMSAEKKLQMENYAKEMENLEFEYEPIEFYPEDVAKMKKMTIREQNDYMLKLKLAKRYKIIKKD